VKESVATALVTSLACIHMSVPKHFVCVVVTQLKTDKLNITHVRYEICNLNSEMTSKNAAFYVVLKRCIFWHNKWRFLFVPNRKQSPTNSCYTESCKQTQEARLSQSTCAFFNKHKCHHRRMWAPPLSQESVASHHIISIQAIYIPFTPD
jgi:hypothetical protein